MISQKYRYPLATAVVAALFFIPFLGRVNLFDWDEINFAESSREMIVTGDYSQVTVGFRPFSEKPPMFFWMQSLAMNIFGVNEFAARLPNAVFGIISLITLFYIGKKERNEEFGLMWASLYFASLLPHLYFKSGIVDPVFNYFTFSGVYLLYRTMHSGQSGLRYAIYSGVLIGLAVLTKGPVGLLVPMLVVAGIVVVIRFETRPKLKDVLAFSLTVFMVSSAWFGLETLRNGSWFIVEFAKYQIELFTRSVSGHHQPWYYHFVVVLVGCFPASVYALGSFGRRRIHDDFGRWMLVFFWVVMILFTIAATKIVHYSSLSFVPLSFLAATYITCLAESGRRANGFIIWAYLGVGILVGVLLTLLPLVSSFKDRIVPLIDDPFAVAAVLKPVAWGGYEFMFGLGYLGAVVVSCSQLLRRKYSRAVIVMAVGTGVLLFNYNVFVMPKVESHTQGSLIEFLRSRRGQDVYVMTYGFHSYAPFYYFEQPYDNVERRADKEYLLNGSADKPVYIISKVTDQTLGKRDDLVLLKEEGGYRFYLRE